MKYFDKIRVINAFKNRREPESVHVLADAYWHSLVMLCVLGAVAIIAFSFWEFTDVDRALAVQPTGVKDSQQKLPFEKNDLQSVIDGFAKRQSTYELFATQTPMVIDPYQVKKTKPTH